MSVIRNPQTCSGTDFPEAVAKPANILPLAQSSAILRLSTAILPLREARPIELQRRSWNPNTLPLQDLKECWSLAASEFALVSMKNVA